MFTMFTRWPPARICHDGKTYGWAMNAIAGGIGNSEPCGRRIATGGTVKYPGPTGEYLTVEQAARLLAVSRVTVYRMLADGLPSLKVRGCRRIARDDLLAWVEDSGDEAESVLYRCQECGTPTEYSGRTRLSACPRCGSQNLRRDIP